MYSPLARDTSFNVSIIAVPSLRLGRILGHRSRGSRDPVHGLWANSVNRARIEKQAADAFCRPRMANSCEPVLSAQLR
jgi:hypothetical protein